MKNGTEAFFNYARTRHQIYLDRAAGRPRPWTQDKILDTYRFTNVFRELDKTTAWFRKNVREPLRTKPEVMLATVVFRLLNRIEVGEAMFLQQTTTGGTAFEEFAVTGDVRHLRRAIRSFVGPRGPYVTGAYIISSPPGYPKLDGVLEVIRRFYEKSTWLTHAQESIRDRGDYSLEDAWKWFSGFDYLGSFHSYEIVTDLRHTALLSEAPDKMTWCNVGPGARRGINRVMGRDKKARVPTAQMLEEMRALLALSQDAQYWPQEWPAWEMREVEHTLCEFDKMERVRLGEGRPRGVYR